MFIPNPVPEGTCYAYVFRLRGAQQFKIGFSQNPTRRRKDMQTRKRRLEECWKCEFETYFAALHVEQLIIAYLKRYGFEPSSSSGEWFYVDEPTMNVVIEIASELAAAIKKWERENWEMDVFPKEGTPYYEVVMAEYYGPNWRERKKPRRMA